MTVVYRWEVGDAKRRSGWRQLAWAMTEDQAGVWARANCRKVRKVEGSREERGNLQGFEQIPAGTPLHFYDDPARRKGSGQ